MSQRPSWRFMLGHPARLIALGFGSGLAPFAPGTFGTAWAWATYVLAERFLAPVPWGWVLLAGTAVGLWACTRCQQHIERPGDVVFVRRQRVGDRARHRGQRRLMEHIVRPGERRVQRRFVGDVDFENFQIAG